MADLAFCGADFSSSTQTNIIFDSRLWLESSHQHGMPALNLISGPGKMNDPQVFFERLPVFQG